MPETINRPQPEALLAEVKRAGRGRLKVFLGASPGVGKTYAMLEAAHRRQRDGVDVIIALVETHGRSETAALLSIIEQLPRRPYNYRGRQLAEMDIDALLRRRPQLALIDELAHSNAPGSRHPKRWQDVMEVLDAGIDVMTTLNIQHIESLNDIVARITGVRVQETLPDEVFQRADEIELVDITPDELLERLRQGRVYIPEQIGRALNSFFSKGNLTALRELAMRTAAQRVDAEMLEIMQANAVAGPWPAEERLLVCVNESPVAKTLVRAAKRMAERAKIPWIAATVITPRHEYLGVHARTATMEALRLAESLGAETMTLRAESNSADELLRFARSRNVTRLVIGRPHRQMFFNFFREPVSEKLLSAARDFEVTVVAADEPKQGLWPRFKMRWPQASGFVEAFTGVAITTLISWPLFPYVPVASLSIAYLLAVLIIAMRHGLAASIFACVVGFLSYNFFFTTPYYSFAVQQNESLVALFVFFISAIFTGTLASRLKAQVETMRAAQNRTETLYDFSRKIASVSNLDDVLWAAAQHLAATLNCRSVILMPNASGELQIMKSYPPVNSLDPKDWGAVRWAWEKAEVAGRGTSTLPASEWLFLPLSTVEKPLGVIGVQFVQSPHFDDPEVRRLLDAVEDQVAVAVERTSYAADLAETRVKAEGEKLRSALLNSVSHDLRTPLVSIIGAAATLNDNGVALRNEDREALLSNVLTEAKRLDRFVQNLLDMTKLGYGAIEPHRAAVDLREIIGTVRNDMKNILQNHKVTADIKKNLPPISVDPVLIGQVLVNVLENAAKYAPQHTDIRITTEVKKDDVLLSITDQGPGIPLADREAVFDLFYRVKAQDRQVSGTGLGLAIAKGFVEANGGSILAKTAKDGRGTRMEIMLPLANKQQIRNWRNDRRKADSHR